MSWIAWHNARQTVSTLCFLVLIAALLLECNAQSLERGVRAPKNKFIRFGRSSAHWNDYGERRRASYESDFPDESLMSDTHQQPEVINSWSIFGR
uniref:Venom peptide n=1 Tax=Panagrellus redivivus TaxID=6233 RepID=A0A7E4W4N8_PANRE